VALFVFARSVFQSTMGKKKAKDKQKQKAKPVKVSRQDLQDEIDRLRQRNEQLQAKLERIAEIAATDVDAGESDGFQLEESLAS
jgi:hypothetical protein